MALQRLKENNIILASIILLLIITLLAPNLVPSYPYFIDWKTILALATLFLITTAIRDSGYLDFLAMKIIGKVKGERELAIIFTLLAFLLSMVITNDVTLLVLVPLTLSLQKHVAKDIKKIIIFEAMAVNAGSALTPIGNPQNLYLWHLWDIGFLNFVAYLLPISLLMLLLLLIFLFFTFPKKCMGKMEASGNLEKDMIMVVISILLLIIFVISIDMGFELYIIPLVFIIYLIYGRQVYRHVDWPLLLLFILLFLDFNALGHIPFIEEFLSSRNLSGVSTFIYASLFSQFMSNVPAAVLLGNFTKDMKSLVYGVSVGGNGTIIASLANLIALRYVKDKKWVLDFHKYSIAYFLASFAIVILLYRIIF